MQMIDLQNNALFVKKNAFGVTVVLYKTHAKIITMLNQRLAQKQRIKILPQQIQLLNFFHLNTLELEQRIQQEIEDNPLLEDQKNEFETLADKYNKDAVQDYQDWEEYGYDDIPDYKLEYGNYLHNDKVPERPIVNYQDYRKGVKEQFKLSCESERECELAEYIIDSLNDHGLMEQSLDELAEDISFKYNKWVEPQKLRPCCKRSRNLTRLE
jgi:RNA polymerase sigma-54 factor